MQGKSGTAHEPSAASFQTTSETRPVSAGVPSLSPRRRTAILAVVSVALMTVVSAVSGLNVALPDVARDTGASQTQLTWIVDAYTVVFAGLLLFLGALGDRYGRRALLVIGLTVFAAASVWGTTITEPTMLIAARAVMGVGAACVMPTTLSVITTSFPVEDRGRAVGVWVGVAGGGAVIGLFGAGILLEYFAWNSFFALNVALAVVALIGAFAVVPNSRDPHPAALDALGGLLSLALVGSLVFGIIEGADRGWTDPLTLAAFGVAALAGPAFYVRERTTAEPLLDVRLFRRRGLSAGTLSATVQFFASFGFFFIVIQYLQFVLGRSPLQAALNLLPLPLFLLPAARLAPRLADRFGANRVAAIGLMFIAAGLGLVSRITVEFEPWVFFPGICVFALGMGLAGTPATTAITSSLPESKQGVASAVNDLARELGSALGIAVLGSVLTSNYRSALAPALAGLPQQVADGARSSIAFVSSDAVRQLGPTADGLIQAAKTSFVDGVSAAVGTASAVLVVTAVVIWFLGPRGVDTAVAVRIDHPERTEALDAHH